MAGRKPVVNETCKEIVAALQFTGLANKVGTNPLIYQVHTLFNEGWAMAYDGVIAAALPIKAGFNGYPQTKLFKDALSNVGKDMAITVDYAENAITVKSGDYESLVPMGDPDAVLSTEADPNVFSFGEGADKFIDALDAAGTMTKDNGELLIDSSLFFAGRSIYGTNRNVFIEAYHGFDLPYGVAMPKALAIAAVKARAQKRVLTGYGFTPDRSMTLHYQDGAYIRCNVFNENWPADTLTKINSLFKEVEFESVPKGFLEALKAVEPFTDEDGGRVELAADEVRCDNAHKKVLGLRKGGQFHCKALIAIEPLALNIYTGGHTEGDNFQFWGAVARGVVANYVPDVEEEQEMPGTTGWGTTGEQVLHDTTTDDTPPWLQPAKQEDGIPY